MNEKQHRPDWTEYFLDIAKAVGRRATCLRRRYGAIIVKDKIIISTGYNGAPRGEANCIDTGNCERERLHVPKGQNYELCVAVHAEQNAIINADSAAMTPGRRTVPSSVSTAKPPCSRPGSSAAIRSRSMVSIVSTVSTVHFLS